MDIVDKITRIAHWRLNRREADDIVRDYQEIFSDCISDGREISCDLKTVIQGIKDSSDPKQYWTWMIVFGLMIFPLISVVSSAFSREYYLRWMLCLFVVGLGSSILHFFLIDHAKLCNPIPKKLLLSLLFLIALSGIVCMYIWLNVQVFPIFIEPSIRGWFGRSVTWTIQIGCIIVGLIGCYGVYMSRVCDRRWRAVYSAGLTIALLGILTLSYLHSFDLGAHLWMTYCKYGCTILGIGIVGTGVSLI